MVLLTAEIETTRYPLSPRTRALRAILDKLIPGQWRVEWFDDDGGCEVEIFTGSNARERALHYADRQYGDFDELKLDPYPP